MMDYRKTLYRMLVQIRNTMTVFFEKYHNSFCVPVRLVQGVCMRLGVTMTREAQNGKKGLWKEEKQEYINESRGRRAEGLPQC